MNLVEPIRDPEAVKRFKEVARRRGIRDYALIMFGLNTALRINEILSLRVKDVYDERGRVRNEVQVRMKKVKKMKIVSINRALKEVLKKYKEHLGDVDPNRPLFMSQNGNVLSRVQAWRIVKACQKAAGVENNLGTHSLRKTWGYQARKRGVPLELIQVKLGHTNPRTTMRYIGITQDEIREIEQAIEI